MIARRIEHALLLLLLLLLLVLQLLAKTSEATKDRLVGLRRLK